MLLIKDIPSRSLQLQKVITGQNTENNWCPASVEITAQSLYPALRDCLERRLGKILRISGPDGLLRECLLYITGELYYLNLSNMVT